MRIITKTRITFSRGRSTKISMEIIVQKARKWMPYISYRFTHVLGYEVHGFMYRYLKCLDIHLFVYMRIIYDKYIHLKRRKIRGLLSGGYVHIII